MSSRTAADYFGFLNIAKPAGVTAHDVVAAARRILRIKQIGHAGTLDPMATGVLPLAVGKATRLLRFLPGDKTYLAEIKLGLQTTTDDIAGDIISGDGDQAMPTPAQLAFALVNFRGPIKQTPPLYSAVHVGGRRLYEMARKGEAPDAVPEREVTVFALDQLSYQPPVVTLRIHCSSGTYIRSIARDLGAKLGCGGCLQSLVREKAGPFELSSAVSLDELKSRAENSTVPEVMVSPQVILELDTYNLDDQQAQLLQHGRALELPAAGLAAPSEPQPPDSVVVKPRSVCAPDREHVLALLRGNLIAVCKRTPEGAGALVKIQPEVVLADANKTGA